MTGTVSTGANWSPSLMVVSSGPNWTPIMGTQQANGFQYLVFQNPGFQAIQINAVAWTPVNTTQTG